MTAEFTLADVPDLSGVFEDYTGPEPWADGTYEARIERERRITDRNGNDRVFESGDSPSANGNGRNIRLQLTVTRKSDGRTLGSQFSVFYRPSDITQETVQAIIAHKESTPEGEKTQWGELFGPFMTLQRLAKLQKIAGVRSFARTEEGGLDISGLYGKKVYARLGPDKRSEGKYKEVLDVSNEPPKRNPVL